jgi:hypothetical protein
MKKKPPPSSPFVLNKETLKNLAIRKPRHELKQTESQTDCGPECTCGLLD